MLNLIMLLLKEGTTDKERFYTPKQHVQGYGNKKVIFRITEEEARTLYLNKEVVVRKVLKTENVNSQRIRRPKRAGQ
jgi:hypothetical protein